MNHCSFPARRAGVLLAGMMLLFGSPACGREPAAAKKSSAATRKIVGRALDSDGRPVAGAIVCLERVIVTEDEISNPVIVAKTDSGADGRFELIALDRDLDTKPTADGPVLFQLWSWKPGLAVTHLGVLTDLSSHPFILVMSAESPLSIRMQKPDGTPCSGATVTPTAACFADWWARIPMPIQKQLKARSAADGRVQLHGSGGRGLMADIETPEFGVQTLCLTGHGSPATPIKLRTTRVVEGRVIVPKGFKADLGKFDGIFRTSRRLVAEPPGGPSQAMWWDRIEIQADAKGRFAVSHLPEGDESFSGGFSDGAPLVPDLRFDALSPLEFTIDGRSVMLDFTPFRSPGTITDAPCRLMLDGRLPTTLQWVSGLLALAHDFQQTPQTGIIEIPFRRGVTVTRVVRDSQTKQPLPGVWVSLTSVRRWKTDALKRIGPRARVVGLPLSVLCSAGQLGLEWSEHTSASATYNGLSMTGEKGSIGVCLVPGKVYATRCRLPEHYVRCRRGTITEDRVPFGVDRCDLEPIDLVRDCTVAGDVLDAAGEPLRDVRVLATIYPEPDTASAQSTEVRRWVSTDEVGQFRFARLEAGSKVTLVPVRDGLPIADPVVLSLNGNQVVHLREKKCECATLAGRILGVDRKPIALAQVMIEVEDTPDPTRSFRTTTGEDGSFRTPARFPKHLKYRVTVRRILKDVASSEWMCPATSGTHFRDLVVDRAKLGLESRIECDEVVARVNGQQIRASELLERACPEPLPPNDMSLLAASALVVSGEMTAPDYRALQETAIRKYVRDYIRTRLLTQALETRLDEDQKKQVEQAIDKLFEKYVEKLKRGFHVTDRGEVDQKLQRLGASLNSVKREFRYRLLADEFARRAGKQEGAIDWQQALTYYNAHRDLYAENEKVAWQLLEIQFDPPHSEQAQTQKKEPANDWNWGETQAERVRTIHDVSDQMQVDLGSFDPKADKATDSEVSSAHWNADSNKSAETSQKKPDEIDVVAYASRSPERPSRQKARGQIQEALAQIHKGELLDGVVKKYSNGRRADRGGWQSRTCPDSLADKATADALRHLGEGQTSGIIETGYSFRIVRLVTRTPAGFKPFEEVVDSIKQALERQRQLKTLDEVYSQATIESPYLDDPMHVFPPPPPCPPQRSPADGAFAE
jgi:parvulin-like peptidyl-prolyl isomerase